MFFPFFKKNCMCFTQENHKTNYVKWEPRLLCNLSPISNLMHYYFLIGYDLQEVVSKVRLFPNKFRKIIWCSIMVKLMSDWVFKIEKREKRKQEFNVFWPSDLCPHHGKPLVAALCLF